jgi:hypothetical protein
MNTAATPAVALRYQKAKTLQTAPSQLDLRDIFCHP